MPNWCSNWVSLTHDDKSKVKALVEDMQKGNFLAHFLPEPNYDGTIEVKPTFPSITGNNKPVEIDVAWYDWRIQNWGTKWEINLEECSWEDGVEDNSVSFGFDSAWSPPIGVYDKAHELGWNVSATYEEGGCDFVGEYEDGVDNCVSMQESFEDGTMPEWALEQVGDYLFQSMLDDERIDENGNLLDEDGKIEKKHGEWGCVKFNEGEINARK